MDNVSRKHKDGSSHTYPCPPAIAEYNRKMGGVDNDQLTGYYHVRLKCRKYCKYIFWFLFDLMVTNSFILCRDFTDMPYKSVKVLGCFGKRADWQLHEQERTRPSSSPQLLVNFVRLTSPERRMVDTATTATITSRHQTVWHCRDCNVFLS